jgi:hypothetical protein
MRMENFCRRAFVQSCFLKLSLEGGNVVENRMAMLGNHEMQFRGGGKMPGRLCKQVMLGSYE